MFCHVLQCSKIVLQSFWNTLIFFSARNYHTTSKFLHNQFSASIMHDAVEEMEEGYRSLPKLENVPLPTAESDFGFLFCSIKGVRYFAMPWEL